ncbi:MAG: isoprenoid biosynthesis glyoxalase ElbB [Planctomycetota bacterium]
MPRVAVVLSGCGVYDGAEIHESVSLLLHLSQRGVDYACFAPDKEQAHVVDHLAGAPAEGETRNVLVEAARIARGDIAPLDQLQTDGFDALFAPGGFGAAKNLSSFAFDGADCTVDPGFDRVLNEFRSAGKPIGVCCITPAVLAKALPGTTVTIGEDADTASAIEAMGGVHQNRPINEACVDDANAVVTAPAYMYGDAKIHEVHEGIGQMVEQTLARIGARA